MLVIAFVASALATPPGSPEWTLEERALLEGGRAVYRHWEDDVGGQHGVSAVLVTGTADEVWSHVHDVTHYVEFLPYVTASELLATEPGADEDRYVGRIALTTLGLTTRFQFDHTHHPAESWTSFELSPDGSSPVQGALGWWKIQPYAEGTVLVEYAVDLELRWYVPGFLERRAAKRGLPGVVGAIKRRVESDGG